MKQTMLFCKSIQLIIMFISHYYNLFDLKIKMFFIMNINHPIF